MLFAGKKRIRACNLRRNYEDVLYRWGQIGETFFAILLVAIMFFVAPTLLLLRMCDVQLPYFCIIGWGLLFVLFIMYIYFAVAVTLELKAKLGEFTLWSLKNKLKYLFTQWVIFLCAFALPGGPIICILSKLFEL